MFFTSQILGPRGTASAVSGLVGIALAFFVLSSLAGCGQKGPLYLPVPPQQILRPGTVNPVIAPHVLVVPAAPASTAR